MAGEAAFRFAEVDSPYALSARLVWDIMEALAFR